MIGPREGVYLAAEPSNAHERHTGRSTEAGHRHTASLGPDASVQYTKAMFVHLACP